MSTVAKARFWTAAICLFILALASGHLWAIIAWSFALVFLAGCMDWSGDGDGREFPGRWREP